MTVLLWVLGIIVALVLWIFTGAIVWRVAFFLAREDNEITSNEDRNLFLITCVFWPIAIVFGVVGLTCFGAYKSAVTVGHQFRPVALKAYHSLITVAGVKDYEIPPRKTYHDEVSAIIHAEAERLGLKVEEESV